MIPKEKAAELVNTFINVNYLKDYEGMHYPLAKECALMAVDEIIREYQSMSDLESTLVIEGEIFSVIDKLVYWMEVKQSL
jgi:hypothetical protein